MKVLLIAHTCRPVGGSEPGAAWNWSLHLARRHEVWLLAHPQYRAEADAALRKLGHPFRIVWVELPRWLDPWQPDRDERGHKLHYLLWQRAALGIARQLHKQCSFDVVHQVGLSTVSAPSPFWRLGIPAFWGPIGGGQVAPRAFRAYLGAGWRKEALRSIRVCAMPYRAGLRATASRCALVLATNSETMTLVQRAGARNARLFPDAGVAPASLAPQVPARKRRPEITLVWAGRLEPHKALPLGLEALARARAAMKLRVAGDGPLRGEWQALAGRLGLGAKVEFLGSLTTEALSAAFLAADGFLFTSLRDSFGSVVLEAMAAGLPVITLDHQGVGSFLPRDAGFKVPVTTPEETVAGLAAAIDTFAAMGPERSEMSVSALRFAATQVWSQRTDAVSGWYEEYGFRPAWARSASAA